VGLHMLTEEEISLRECFMLCCSAAFHIHSNDPKSEPTLDAFINTVREVASGSLTLMDSWAEFRRATKLAPDETTDAIEIFYELARASERAMATKIVATMDKALRRDPGSDEMTNEGDPNAD
jgi:hypothetical protein